MLLMLGNAFLLTECGVVFFSEANQKVFLLSVLTVPMRYTENNLLT